MDASATVVWLSSQPPDAQESRTLAGWSSAHGVRLTPPVEADVVPIPVDPKVADRVEGLLDRARDALAAHEGTEADAALDAAEALLRAHAELLQGAWLMAEVLRARATRWRRVPPIDVEAAEDAWQRAEALDGGRVAGVGEEAAAKPPPAAALTLDLSPDDARAWLDGKPATAGDVVTSAGLHALVVHWAGAPVWAAWFDAPAGHSTVRIATQVAPACSSDDVARAHLDGRGEIEGRRVRCPTWFAATPGATEGAVRLAMCEADHCGPLSEWRSAPSWSWSPSVRDADVRRRWPAWATWTLVGGGAAIAASVVVLATGVLQGAPSETRFVSGGIRTQ